MTEVKLLHEKPMSVMAIVAELRDLGWIQRRDFDFAYYPAKWDTFDEIEPRHTIFTFYNDSTASWFALKYCGQ